MKILFYSLLFFLSFGSLAAQQIPVRPRPLEFEEGRNKGKAILFHINFYFGEDARLHHDQLAG